MNEEQVALRIRAASRRRLTWLAALVAATTLTVGLSASLYYWGMNNGITRSLDRLNQSQARSTR